MSPLPTHINGARARGATFPLSNSSRQKPRKFVLLCMLVKGRANAELDGPWRFVSPRELFTMVLTTYSHFESPTTVN